MNSISPAISIVMPTYNAAQYIHQSVQSILSQTFTDFELIIIDDGSEDDSIDIIKTFQDDRIVLIENNHNFIESLNMGIGQAKGKYIARMDADDIMVPNRLEMQYYFMENNPDIDICGGWMETLNKRTTIIKSPIEHKEICNSLLSVNCLFHPTIMFRQDSLSGIYFFPNLYKYDYIYAEDYKLWTDLLKEGLRFANIPVVLVQYRIWENQNTSRYSSSMATISKQIQTEYLGYVAEKIVENNDDLFDFINKAIILNNTGELDFLTLRQIISDLSVTSTWQ